MNIKGLDKAVVLQALWTRSFDSGFTRMMGFHSAPFTGVTVEHCRATLRENTYVDYLEGRVIKCDFSTDELDTRLYNRDNGTYAAEKVIERLKKGESIT